MIEVGAIEKVTRNRAGISLIFLFFEDEIVSFPTYNPISEYYTGNILTFGQAHNIYYTVRRAQFRVVADTSGNAGDRFNASISFATPQDRPVVRTFVDKMRNRRVAIIYKDWNGYWKVLRQLRSKSTITSARPGGYCGTFFEFNGASIRPPGFWEFEQNPFVEDTRPDLNAPPPAGSPGSGGGGATSVQFGRYQYVQARGRTFAFPDDPTLPADHNQVLVHVSGVLIPWGLGLRLTGGNMEFDWSLDRETIELIWLIQT